MGDLLKIQPMCLHQTSIGENKGNGVVFGEGRVLYLMVVWDFEENGRQRYGNLIEKEWSIGREMVGEN